jgi:hypothetical protein
MGIDWLKSMAKNYDRRWDKGRDSLAEPDLYTQCPELVKRRYLVRRETEFEFHVGDEYFVKVAPDAVGVFAEFKRVGTVCDLSDDMLGALTKQGGDGRCMVEAVLVLTGMAEVTFA